MIFKDRRIVKFVYACVAFTLLVGPLAPSAAHATLCFRLFNKVIKGARVPSETKNLVLNAASWLMLNGDFIKPTVTHLKEFTPLVQRILEQVEAELEKKQREPEYAALSPMVQAVVAEAKARMRAGQLTYEYVYCLPYRFGFLLNMRGTSDVFKAKVESEIVYQADAYVTHAAFMRMVEAAAPYKSRQFENEKGAPAPASVYEALLTALREFPQTRMIPVPGVLDHQTMNTLMAHGVWPVAFTAPRPVADAAPSDGLKIAFKDLAHLRGTQNFTRQTDAKVTPESFHKVVRTLLERIEMGAHTDSDRRILHFLQYQLFYQSAAKEFKRDDNPAKLIDATKPVASIFKDVLDELTENLLLPREITEDPRILRQQRELELLLPKGETRQQALARVVPVYINHLTAAFGAGL